MNMMFCKHRDYGVVATRRAIAAVPGKRSPCKEKMEDSCVTAAEESTQFLTYFAHVSIRILGRGSWLSGSLYLVRRFDPHHLWLKELGSRRCERPQSGCNHTSLFQGGKH